MSVPYYFACLDLRGKRCLVVGAGAVGAEKANGLLDAGALVTVVAPNAEDDVRTLSRAGKIVWLERLYESGDLDDYFLAIAATSDADVNRRVHADAEARTMLVNVADAPDICNFILPAVHRTGSVAIAVSTSGASPALAQRIRDELAARYQDAVARLADMLLHLRPWAKQHLPTYALRKTFFDSIVRGQPDPIELIANSNYSALSELIKRRQREALAAADETVGSSRR